MTRKEAGVPQETSHIPKSVMDALAVHFEVFPYDYWAGCGLLTGIVHRAGNKAQLPSPNIKEEWEELYGELLHITGRDLKELPPTQTDVNTLKTF